MITFEVKDMSCGHCVASITAAVQAAHPGARVETDLDAHRVSVDAAGADSGTIATAIREAGYTPEPVAE